MEALTASFIFGIIKYMEDKERPIEDLRKGDFGPDNLSNFVELFEYEETEDSKKFIDYLKTAKHALDMGSSRGDTASALAKLCEELESIDTVDAAVSTDLESREEFSEINHTHHKQYINSFLEDNQKVFDIATINAVPDHNIKDYEKLKSAIRDEGYVVESGDTMLDGQKMREVGFEDIYEYGGGLAFRNRLWRKTKQE